MLTAKLKINLFKALETEQFSIAQFKICFLNKNIDFMMNLRIYKSYNFVCSLIACNFSNNDLQSAIKSELLYVRRIYLRNILLHFLTQIE